MPLYSYTYALPYLLLAAVFLFLACYENRTRSWKSKSRLICSILFLFFFGLRGFVAWDWRAYYPAFEAIDNLWDFSLNSFLIITDNGQSIDALEPGFILYVSTIKTLWNDWHFFIFISTLIDWAVFDRLFRKYSPNYALSMLVFLCLYSVLEFDLMRNIKALLIFILSIEYIFKRKLLKFLLLSIIGISLHRSYLIFLPFYFLGTCNLKRPLWIVLFVLSNIIFLLQIPLASKLIPLLGGLMGDQIADKTDAYLSSDIYGQARGFTLGYLIRLVTMGLMLWRYNRIIEWNKRNILFLNMFMVNMLIAFSMSDVSIFTNRTELLLGMSTWILYPVLLTSFRIPSNKYLVSAFFIAYFFLRCAGYGNVMYQYENILFGASDYNTRLSSHSYAAEVLLNSK